MEPVPCSALRFGTFELDLRTGELRKGGLRIKVPEQSIQVLTALVLHPGELVTREELKAKLWPDDTVVEFDTSISHAVWRLRQVLGDTAQTPRFIETFPKKGYRFIYPPWTEKGKADPVSLQQKQPQSPECEEADATAVEHPGKLPEPAAPVSAPAESEISHEILPRERGLRSRWWLALSAVCLLSFAAGWQLHRAPPASPVWKLTRITAEAGLADTPAISPDGKFVAYSFARSEDGARDLYIKRVAGGQSIRLTTGFLA